MNTRDMQIFLKIADYRSITRTAEDFEMTQPAVSSTLKRLEDEVGYPLFYRRGKWLILNEQGRLFYQASQEFLAEIAHVQVGLEAEKHPKSELILEVYNHSDFLFELMGAFSRENRDVRIVLQQGDSAVIDTYRKPDFQVKIDPVNGNDVSYLPLEHKGALYAILPEDHPLTRKHHLQMSDLKGESFVFSRNPSALELEDCYKTCLKFSLEPKISMVTDTNSSKFSAIRRGCGIGLAFDNALSLAPLIKDCKLIPISVPLVSEWVNLCWQEETLSETGKRFLEFVKERV